MARATLVSPRGQLLAASDPRQADGARAAPAALRALLFERLDVEQPALLAEFDFP
jgi:hypothetical protein